MRMLLIVLMDTIIKLTGKWEIYKNKTEYISLNWRTPEWLEPEQGRNVPGFQEELRTWMWQGPTWTSFFSSLGVSTSVSATKNWRPLHRGKAITKRSWALQIVVLLCRGELTLPLSLSPKSQGNIPIGWTCHGHCLALWSEWDRVLEGGGSCVTIWWK